MRTIAALCLYAVLPPTRAPFGLTRRVAPVRDAELWHLVIMRLRIGIGWRGPAGQRLALVAVPKTVKMR